MSSRADSTSPPPYSFEVSSFPPPPPRQGEVARNWDFQAKFESAEEPVRQAVLDTITAWTALPKPTVWEYIPRCSIQDSYDSASTDLRRALDFLIDCNYTTYLSNDQDRREHEYFYRMQTTNSHGPGYRPLQSPAAFVDDLEDACVEIQKAVLKTFGLWQYNHTGEYVKPHMHEVRQAYTMAPPRLKTLLNWVLDSGSIVAAQNLEETKMFNESSRKHLEKTIAIKHKAQPLV